jgi:lipoprotein-anchoring transpeptidase ErfK/SrfK
MNRNISRRDFLKLSGLALSGLAFTRGLRIGQNTPPPPTATPFESPPFTQATPITKGMPFTPVFSHPEEQDQGLIARVTIKEIDLRSQARDTAPIIGKRYRDQLVHIYYSLTPPDAPIYYNPLWYRVWGGYLHSAYLQIVKFRLNQPLGSVPDAGQLCEVTVPYTPAYEHTASGKWQVKQGYTLYYETTHWATGIEEGPDRQPWYQVTSELDSSIYYVPAIHLRPIPPAEIAPLSPNVPPEKKRIHVSLSQQSLTAYENDQAVFSTKISSGIPSRGTTPNGIPTATPRGRFNIYSKMPSKHMGAVTGNPDIEEHGGFRLPGVPWTSFFAPQGGVAFHGTYWHNNFGLQMSHGCVNMRNADAKWLFRWCTPVFNPEIKDRGGWEQTGNGTVVDVD